MVCNRVLVISWQAVCSFAVTACAYTTSQCTSKTISANYAKRRTNRISVGLSFRRSTHVNFNLGHSKKPVNLHVLNCAVKPPNWLAESDLNLMYMERAMVMLLGMLLPQYLPNTLDRSLPSRTST